MLNGQQESLHGPEIELQIDAIVTRAVEGKE
jgi:hypothetical protein